jgi:hypothetical protein
MYSEALLVTAKSFPCYSTHASRQPPLLECGGMGRRSLDGAFFDRHESKNPQAPPRLGIPANVIAAGGLSRPSRSRAPRRERARSRRGRLRCGGRRQIAAACPAPSPNPRLAALHRPRRVSQRARGAGARRPPRLRQKLRRCRPRHAAFSSKTCEALLASCDA